MKWNLTTKKKLYSVIAGTLTVAMVGTSIHFSGQQAMAKETFQGIKDIVDENSMLNPFQIVEIVPGTGLYTVDVSDIDGSKPVELELSLGELGYYIDGEEPTEFDSNLKKFESSEGRYKYSELLLKADSTGTLNGGALLSITSQENDDSKPLYYIPYDEDYNLTQAELDALAAEGKEYKELEYEITPAEQKISRRQMVSALDGRFLKTYSPRDDQGELVPAEAIRDRFENYILALTVSGNEPEQLKGINFKPGHGKGDFDPNFIPDENGKYNVIFEKNTAPYGYRVTEAAPAYKGDEDVAPGTYLYEKYVSENGVYYKYAGRYTDMESILPEKPEEPENDGGNSDSSDDPSKKKDLEDDGEAEEPRSSEEEDVNGSEEDMGETEEAADSTEGSQQDETNESQDVVPDEGGSQSDTGFGSSSSDGDKSSEGGQSESSSGDSSDEGNKSDEGSSDDKKEESSDEKKEESSDEKKEESSDEKKEESSDEKKDESDNDKKEKEEKSSDDGEKEARAFISIRPHSAHDDGEEGEESSKDALSEFLEDAKGDHEDDAEFEEMQDDDSQKENVSAVEEEYIDVSGVESDEPVEVSEEEVLDEVEEDVNMAESEDVTGSGEYYIVKFEYDSSSPLGEGEYSYTAASWRTSGAGFSSNAYSLVSATAESSKDFVVPNFSGDGQLLADGEEDFLYEAKTPAVDEEGNISRTYGNYNLVKPENSEDAGIYRVSNIKVYYKGVFGNANWFTRYVFDRDTAYLDDGSPTVYYSYNVAKAGSLANIEVGNVGMLYISAGLGAMLPEGYLRQYRDEDGVLQDTKYDKNLNDISVSTMMGVLDAVVNSELPVMVDYSIIEDASLKGTNIQKLAILLQQNDVAAFYEDNYMQADSVIEAMDPPTDYFKLNPQDHHVNKSVYVYNYSKSKTTMANAFFLEESSEYSIGVGTGFDEIRDEIKDENLLREVNGVASATIPNTVNEAVAIKYIISYRGRRAAYVKETVTVLEIQPRAVPEDVDDKFEGHLYVEEVENPDDDSEIRYALKRKSASGIPDTYLLGGTTFDRCLPNEIKLVSMGVNEFNGHDADINSLYDMIYIGLSPFNFNREKDSNGRWRTVYNDKDMDGLLYTNLGDRIRNTHISSGLLDRDLPLHGEYEVSGGEGNYTNTQRAPGNDLTSTKVDALMSFLKGGYPLIVDHNCYYGDDDEDDAFPDVFDGPNSGGKGYIDNASNMYEFLERARDEIGDGLNTRNVFRLDSGNGVSRFTSMLNWSLNLPKPQMEVWLNKDKKPNDGYATAKPADGSYVFTFRVEITDKRSTDDDDSYDVDLYLDYNNDGKFADNPKEKAAKDALSIESSGGSDMGLSNGKYKLKAGKVYNIEYNASNIFKANDQELKSRPFAFKLVTRLNRTDELSSEEAKARRCECIGCYFIRAQSDPMLIKFLQIIPNEWKKGAISWDMEHDKLGTSDWTGGTTMPGATGWETALGRVTELYTIEKHTLTSTEFIDELMADGDYLDNEEYTLLILGFGADYSVLEDDVYTKMVARDGDGNTIRDSNGKVTYGDNMSDAQKSEYMAWAKTAEDKLRAWVNEGRGLVIGPCVVSYMNTPRKTDPEFADFGSVYVYDKAQSKGGNWYGFHNTRYFRALAGMDRYGISQRRMWRDGTGHSNNEPLVAPAPSNMGDILRTGSYSKDDLRTANDLSVAYAYDPNGDGRLSNDVYGETEALLNWLKAGNGYTTYNVGYNRNDDTSESSAEAGYGDVSGGVDRDKATKVLMNLGTITLFPNRLDDRMQAVDNNELPPYSLDLVGDGYDGAKDGQPDTTVWYAYNDGNTHMKANAGDAGSLYFLATRGNVTFLNLLKWPHPAMMDMVINVLINAAIANPDKAHIKFYDDKEAKYSTNKLYLPYEKINDAESGLTGETMDLYFKSSGFAPGHTDLLTKFYIIVDNEEDADMVYEGKFLKEIENPVVTKVDSDTVLEQNSITLSKKKKDETYTGIQLDDSDPNIIYDLHMPVSSFASYFGGIDRESVDVFVIQTEITSRGASGDGRKVRTSSSQTQLIKAELFTLD